MAEWQLFEPGTVPEHTRPDWYAGRDAAPHVDEPWQRPRMDIAARMVRDIAAERHLTFVSDLGAGDGGMLTLLDDPGLECWGYDLQPANVARASERGVHAELGDVVNDEDLSWGEIAVCTEVLEHLVDPHAFVRKIWRNAQVLVASSPYTETAAAHYPFHTWAWDLDGYREMLEGAGWVVRRVETWSMFQVVLACAF